MKAFLVLALIAGLNASVALACDCDKGSKCQKAHEKKCKGDKACLEKEMAACGHHKDCSDKNGSCSEHHGEDKK